MLSQMNNNGATLDGLKVTYPKRKPENQDKEPIDTLVDESELFDCYVRSDTE